MLGGHLENVTIYEGTWKGMKFLYPSQFAEIILNDLFVSFSKFKILLLNDIVSHILTTVILYWQVVKIGVVGGSDLVKISEQLGQTGQLQSVNLNIKIIMLMK